MARSVGSYATSRRWTAEQARAALEAQTRSGLSVAAFAQHAGLDAERLYRWRRHFKGAVDGAARAAFVEVPRELAFGPVEVVLRSGRTLRVSEAIAADALRRLVSVLEESLGC